MTAPNIGTTGTTSPTPAAGAATASTTTPAPTAPIAPAPITGDVPAIPLGGEAEARAYYDRVAADKAAEKRPRKLAAKGEADYVEGWTERASVYVDGREVRRVLSADADAGVVRRIADPAAPGMKADRNRVDTMRGRVEIHYRAPGAGTAFVLDDVADAGTAGTR